MAQATKDYGQFKFMPGNRGVRRAHVNNLKRSITKNPKLLEAAPIMVNENGYVIDGQHRLTAAMELEVPIYYTQIKGLTIENTRDLNSTAVVWRIMDYAKSYAQSGNGDYQDFLEYAKNYPKVNPSNIQIVLMKANRSVDLTSTFRSGEFKIKRHNDSAEDILHALNFIKELTNIPVSRAFAMAFQEAYEAEGFDLDVFLRNLEVKPSIYVRTSTLKEAFRVIEDIVNYRKTSNLLRLY